jgi:hypothetical protein
VFFLQENEAVETYHHTSLYRDQDVVDYYPDRRKMERNQEILAQYQAGTSVSALADKFGISLQRVHQIVND